MVSFFIKMILVVFMLIEKINGDSIERGGYAFVPKKYEFWQGNENKVDDRILYRKPYGDELLDWGAFIPGDNGWILQLLSP